MTTTHLKADQKITLKIEITGGTHSVADLLEDLAADLDNQKVEPSIFDHLGNKAGTVEITTHE